MLKSRPFRGDARYARGARHARFLACTGVFLRSRCARGTMSRLCAAIGAVRRPFGDMARLPVRGWAARDGAAIQLVLRRRADCVTPDAELESRGPDQEVLDVEADYVRAGAPRMSGRLRACRVTAARM